MKKIYPTVLLLRFFLCGCGLVDAIVTLDAGAGTPGVAKLVLAVIICPLWDVLFILKS
jgi:hypothetical protein